MNLKAPVHNGLAIFIGFSAIVGVVLYFFVSRAYYDGDILSERQSATIYEKDYVRINEVNLHTDAGDIRIKFEKGFATNTIDNFVKLSKSGFYNQTRFHRVVKDFMIQGGDPSSRGDDISLYGRGGPGYTFKDEINYLPMIRGAVAMANKGPNTNGSQFFILTGDRPSIEGKYTIFGYVVDGMDNVDAISDAQTEGERPLNLVGINSIDIVE